MELMRSRLFAAMAAASILAGVAPSEAKTLVYCSEGSPENFNPMINTTGTTFDANRPIYEQLLAFKRGTTETEPSLAESWTVSPDGKSYTFKIRSGVKWHSNRTFKPTRDLNADDVVFSFERQWKDTNPFHKVSGGAYDYFNDMDMPALLESITKVDDLTVRFVLKEPQTPFLANLAMDFAVIQSKEYADALLKAGKPETLDQEPIGTGPFEFVQYQRDATIRYRANAGYWGQKAKVDSLVFAITKEASVRLAKLRANECQIIPFPNPADLEAIRKDPTLKMDEQPGLNIGYLALNNSKPPFNDKRLRMAINLGIDRKPILDAVYQGAGQPAKNLIPPTMWSYNNDIQPYPYDPEAAKKIVDEVAPGGLDIDLWAMPVQRPYNPNARRIAELMQSDLAKINIRAKIVSYEWGEYRKRAQNSEHMAVQLGWTGDNGDPDNFFAPLASCAAARPGGGSVSKWCNQEFDTLIRRAATLPDQAERAKLYSQAQTIMHQEVPFFLIAHSVVFMPMRKEVTGYTMSPLGSHQFDRVDIKE